ncbi:hypothetical protein TNCV_1024201 [Trichonephila clavipes]|nr:hypothetical protein TNCV_1024201 [Trichonephila clavipes]
MHGEGKSIMPVRHGGTLNSRRAASPHVRLEEGEETWEVPDNLQVVLPQNWGKVDSAFHLFRGTINEYQTCLGTKTLGVSLQIDHLFTTSANAPQHPMVTYTGMGTVGLGPHGLLLYCNRSHTVRERTNTAESCCDDGSVAEQRSKREGVDTESVHNVMPSAGK